MLKAFISRLITSQTFTDMPPTFFQKKINSQTCHSNESVSACGDVHIREVGYWTCQLTREGGSCQQSIALFTRCLEHSLIQVNFQQSIFHSLSILYLPTTVLLPNIHIWLNY